MAPKKGIVSLPLALGFDPSALQIISVSEGEFMKQGGVTTQVNTRVDAGGQVLVTLTRDGDSGAMAPGRVLTLNARALAVNRSTVVQVLTVAPQGEGAAAVNVALPPALQIAITP